jgi:hypothetical protein
VADSSSTLGREASYAFRDMGDVLEEFGHERAPNPEMLRAMMDQDVLPKIMPLLGMEVDEALTLETVDEIAERIRAYVATDTFKSLVKASDEKVEMFGATIAESKLGLVNAESLSTLLTTKQLSQEEYDELKRLPPQYIDNLKGIVDFMRHPAKVTAFTDNLRTLVEAGVIGTPPQPAVQVVEADVGAESTVTESGTAAEPVVSSFVDTPTVSAPASVASPPSPADEFDGYDTVEDASKWAERYLREFHEKLDNLPEQGAPDGVFDEKSQLTAWAIITGMKDAVGITSADGLYNREVSALLKREFKELENTSEPQTVFEESHRAKMNMYIDAIGGKERLQEFLLAMDVLAVNGKLLEKLPEPEVKGESPIDGLKEIRDLMVQFLGADQTNSIINMIFGFIAEFLGMLGIDAGPIVKGLGLGEALGLTDSEGNDLTDEQRHQALQELYTKAYQDAGGDPAKLREATLAEIDKQFDEGGLFTKIVGYFGGKDTLKERVLSALDAAAKETTPEARAKAFADHTHGQAVEVSSVVTPVQSTPTPAPANTAPPAAPQSSTPPQPNTPPVQQQPVTSPPPTPPQPAAPQGEQRSNDAATVKLMALHEEFTPQATATVFNPANAPLVSEEFSAASYKYGTTMGRFMMTAAEITNQVADNDDAPQRDHTLDNDRELTA